MFYEICWQRIGLRWVGECRFTSAVTVKYVSLLQWIDEKKDK